MVIPFPARQERASRPSHDSSLNELLRFLHEAEPSEGLQCAVDRIADQERQAICLELAQLHATCNAGARDLPKRLF